ncbi:MAG TPA: HAMP domain-containing sensor histidine kinase [Nocardioidaceae bacterium]|nr:HAMP domain-containing sensor histidine kinase [Nocardioidaceae bacterium]
MTTERSRLVLSVRTRITIAVGLLVAVALTAAGALVFALGHASIEDRVRAQVDQELAEFARFQETSDHSTSRGLVTSFLEQNVGTDAELLVGYWDGETKVRSFSEMSYFADEPVFERVADELAASGRARWLQTNVGEVYVASQPLSDRGAFLVAYFLEDEYDGLHETLRTYAVAAALALALVTAMAAWLAGRLLRPVRTLRRAAEEIESGGDLSRRIPETGNDDITDLTRTVNAMLARLEHAFATQRAFLDDAGHELRTPLTIVRGHLELLDVGDPAEITRTRDLVLDEVDRMSRLVQDLMTLAKSERPDFFVFETVDVGSLVEDVRDKCRALGDRTWLLDARAGGAAELDVQRITQALLQLAHNAVRHTGPGDVVAIGSEREGDTLRLWVRDTGPGVPDEHKTAVFDRFDRGAATVGDEGFGLGLSIVRAIAHGHGGGVAILDAQPHGARVVIEIPMRRSSAWPAS